MKRKTLILTVVFILGFAALAFAAEAGEMERVVGLNFFLYSAVVAGFAIAISSIGCGYSQGIAIRSAVEGVARNPEASGKITVTMMIGLAMVESLAIYVFVVAMIILFANPFTEQVVQLLAK